VGLFKDLNGDGKPEPNEFVKTTTTNKSGYYEFVVSDVSATYFVVVNSTTVNTTRGLNPGYSVEDIWAEQTYIVLWKGLNISEWYVNGDASVKVDKIVLTPCENYKRGSVWFYKKVNLSKDFVIKFKAYLGGSDGGADGITFTLQSEGKNALGGYGSSLGYSDISPSVAVELDTYYSPWSGFKDPDSRKDHIAILVNGSLNHTYLNQTYGVYPAELDNIEDGREHDVVVEWNASNHELKVFFDGIERLNWSYNIVNQIFGGNPEVFFGFTGATGGCRNYQYVRPYEVRNGDETILQTILENQTKFGGENATRSDNWSAGIYEHYAVVNIPTYNNESVDFGFSFDVIVNVKDADDDPNSGRYAQGTLRQFILNANAIAGEDRSYFVMMVDPNSQKWWTITVNSSLPALPAIADADTELNGTVFYPNMTIRDENRGYILYNYTTQDLESYDTQREVAVGVGSDGVPFSGDEPKLKAVPKPEVEIYGNVLNVSADNCVLSSLSIFGADYGIKSYGANTLIKLVFVGLRANGSDPDDGGLNRNENGGIMVYSNNTTILDSIVAFNGGSGVAFQGDCVDLGAVKNVQAYGNCEDGLSMDQGASNVTFENCLASKNSGFGVDSWFGKVGLKLTNCTLEFNEIGGARILANDSVLVYNLIRENEGSGVVIGRTAYYSAYGINITKNSIYNNTWIGIDIDGGDSYCGDNVTLNDGSLDESRPNYGVDYPVITRIYLNDNNLYVEGYIGDEGVGASPTFCGATVEVYLVRNSTGGDDLLGNNVSSDGSTLDRYYGEGWIYLGTLQADSNGRFYGTIDVSGKGVEESYYITAIATLNGNTSEFGPIYQLNKTYRDVKASVNVVWTDGCYNVTITVTAFNKTQHDVTVYWVKPENLTIESMSGDYESWCNSGDVYWWTFDEIDAGETKHVYLNLSAFGDFSLSDAFIVGVDPR